MNRHFSKEDTNGQGTHENMLNMTFREIKIKTRYYFILIAAAAAAKSLQPCLTLYDPIDGSPPGSSVPGILQARILEWVAIFFSVILIRIAIIKKQNITMLAGMERNWNSCALLVEKQMV